MVKKIILNKNLLIQKYINENKIVKEVAKELNVSCSLIYKHFILYEIKKRKYEGHSKEIREKISKKVKENYERKSIIHKCVICNNIFQNKTYQGVYCNICIQPKLCKCGCEKMITTPDRFFHKGYKSKSFSEEARINMSKARRKQYKNGYINPNKGKILSENIKIKISETLKKLFKEDKIKIFSKKGIKLSEEHKKKISEASKSGRSGWSIYHRKIKDGIVKHHLKDKKLSEERRIFLQEKRKTQVFPIKDTTIEIKIQNYLKELNIEFFTHQYIDIEHGYQSDIFIPLLKMVIECDGNYWHKYPIGNEIDHIRSRELLEKGFKVLRLWEVDIRSMTLEDLKNKLVEVK